MTFALRRRLRTILSCTPGFLLLFLAAVANAAEPPTLGNPLQNAYDSIPQFIAGVLQVVVMVAMPIIVLFFVWAGFLFIKAQGNPGKLDEAKKNLMYAVIGAILILGAWVIATLIAGTVTELVGRK